MPSELENPFVSHYHTNYCPNVAELVQIKDLLRHPDAQITQINSEIVELQATLATLLQKKQELQDSTKPLRALGSIIRQFPQEILEEIFLCCLSQGSLPTISPSSAPVVLTHVCRSWRSTALNTSRLWAGLLITIPFSFPEPILWKARSASSRSETLDARGWDVLTRAYLQEIEIWLSRSRQAPLSITLHQSDNSNSQEDRCFTRMLELLITHTYRWKSISISSPIRVVSKLVELAQDDLPLLHSLAIHCCSRAHLRGSLTPNPKWSKSGLFRAVQLRSIFLSRFDEDIISLPIPYSQLTSLSISGYTPKSDSFDVYTACQILQLCPLLVDCKLALTVASTEANIEFFLADRPPIPIVMDKLQKFTMDEGFASSDILFERLEAVALEDVEFYTSERIKDHFHYISLLIFLNKFGSQITRFKTNLSFPGDRVQILNLLVSACELLTCQAYTPLISGFDLVLH